MAGPSDLPQRRRGGWLRLRALLAGGVVLGLGSAATLAAWNDSEYASSTVSASTFGLEGSANGEPFTEHATLEDAAELAFAPPLPQMSPGQSGFLRFSVRTTTSSSVGGTVSLQTPTLSTDGTTALRDALRYGVRVMPGGSSCDAALFTNPSAPVIVPNDSLLTASVPANARNLQAAAGSTVDYCARLSMISSADNAAQGRTLTVTWQFLAEST